MCDRKENVNAPNTCPCPTRRAQCTRCGVYNCKLCPPIVNFGVRQNVATVSQLCACGEATGAVGPTGERGATGANGANGLPGATGPSGANGLPGATGPSGANGLPGATGPSGADGLPGATGPTGTCDCPDENEYITLTFDPSFTVALDKTSYESGNPNNYNSQRRYATLPRPEGLDPKTLRSIEVISRRGQNLSISDAIMNIRIRLCNGNVVSTLDEFNFSNEIVIENQLLSDPVWPTTSLGGPFMIDIEGKHSIDISGTGAGDVGRILSATLCFGPADPPSDP